MRPSSIKALSLLEILFTIGLLTVILVAFAAVYPSAYRLNRKSARSAIAAKTASAVAAEVMALPFDPPSFNNTQSNLSDLANDLSGGGAMAVFVGQRMRTTIPNGYEIRPQGLRVSISGRQPGQVRFAEVQVTCYYHDAQATGMEKFATIISGKAENRDVR